MSEVLEEKVGVITGAGSGIGRATAIAAAKAGSKVVVSDISAESGNETVAIIRESGGEASFIQTDVSDPDAVGRMVAFAVDQYGGLNWACNNAAAGQFGPFIDTTQEVWDLTVGVTLSGVFYCMVEEIKVMLPAGGGNIVNMPVRKRRIHSDRRRNRVELSFKPVIPGRAVIRSGRSSNSRTTKRTINHGIHS